MSASCDLTTLAASKRHLGVSGSDDDTLIDELIDAASEAIERYCGREFNEESRTEYYDGGADHVVLRARPVSTVTSLHDDPGRDFGARSLVDPSRYAVDELAGIVELDGGRFGKGRLSVKVVYTGGFAAVPDDVSRACAILVAHWYNRAKQGSEGVASEGMGPYAARYDSTQWPQEVLGLLWSRREVRL